MRLWKYLSMMCIAVLAAAVGVGAADYETPKNRSVKDVLPAAVAAGADYTVSDPVVADGYMYQFKVKSPYAVFDVTGTGALRKLEREIWAIGQLKQVTKSEAFLKSLKDQAGKPLVFAKDVVTKPGETLSGIPKGVSRLFSNAATATAPEPSTRALCMRANQRMLSAISCSVTTTISSSAKRPSTNSGHRGAKSIARIATPKTATRTGVNQASTRSFLSR